MKRQTKPAQKRRAFERRRKVHLERARIRWKSYVKKRNRLGYSPSNSHIRFSGKEGTYRKIEVPRNMSFIENPIEVLQFFNRMRVLLHGGYSVRIDMANVGKLGNDAIALLLSHISDPAFTNGCNIGGNRPLDPEQRKMLEQSGFFEHVKSRDKPKSKDQMILRPEKGMKADNLLADQIVAFATSHTYGVARNAPAVYSTFVELMTNTNNHADLERIEVKRWWLTVYYDSKSRITSFSFVDTGVGIFQSLRKGKLNVLQKLGLNTKTNAELMTAITKGKIRSRTGKKERGRGLHGIFKWYSNRRISRLVIISNDVFANFDGTPQIVEMSPPFRGTFIYWELHPQPLINGDSGENSNQYGLFEDSGVAVS